MEFTSRLKVITIWLIPYWSASHCCRIKARPQHQHRPSRATTGVASRVPRALHCATLIRAAPCAAGSSAVVAVPSASFTLIVGESNSVSVANTLSPILFRCLNRIAITLRRNNILRKCRRFQPLRRSTAFFIRTLVTLPKFIFLVSVCQYFFVVYIELQLQCAAISWLPF